MKHLLYTLLLGVFLTSCYRKIDLDEYRTTPKMVINSVVSPDTVVMASITRTWFYPDKKPYVNLPHAHVELYINNQYIETMQWKTLNNPRNPDQPDTLFLSNTIPAEGDRIKIVASTPSRYVPHNSINRHNICQKDTQKPFLLLFAGPPTILHKYPLKI